MNENDKKQNLAAQDLTKLDITKITPLTQEIMSRQATINIGTIGHVSHGKSTVVKAISGVKTTRFKTEMQNNITIKLGYANAKIYKCNNSNCNRPSCYTSYGSNSSDEIPCEQLNCKGKLELIRHVSLIDCPGHDVLMATMLNGAAIMDAALLLIAGNEICPQPQTSEHLLAVEIMKLKNIIILQNKIDLTKESESIKRHNEIKTFVKGTVAENSPIIPISAQLKYNIDVLCEYIVKHIPVPVRDYTSSPKMIIVRSFDVNNPGEKVDDLKGGVAGGTILQGVLRKGQQIEIRPGIISKDINGTLKCTPIFSTIVSLFAEQNQLEYAVPGGLIGVGTKIDPTLTRSDRLVGQVIGNIGTLPDVYYQLEINYTLLSKLLGVKTENTDKVNISKLQKGEILMINIASTSTGGRIIAIKKDLAKISLTQPVCTSIGEKLAISRKIDNHFRLIGWGKIKAGKKF